MPWYRWITVFAAIAGAVLITPIDIGASEPLAVIVSDKCDLTDISTDELQKFYLGKTTMHTDECEIRLLAYQPSVKAFYRIVLDMTLLRFRKHWMKLVFAGEFATPPEECSTIADLKQRLCNNPGAIGFLPLSKVEGCMKILTIDGKQPDDSGYLLK